jgi:hypothetical protein
MLIRRSTLCSSAYIPLWWVKNVIVQKSALRGFVPYPDGDLVSLKNIAFLPGHDPS